MDGLGLGMELGVGGFNEVGLTLLILFTILGRTQGEEDGEERIANGELPERPSFVLIAHPSPKLSSPTHNHRTQY